MATVQRAVVDRIVDDVHAVLLVGPDEVEHIVHRSLLPEDVSEGTWLQVRFEAGELVFAAVDDEATADATQRVASKLAALRQRGSRLRRAEPVAESSADEAPDGGSDAATDD